MLQLDAGMGAMRKAGTMVTAEGVAGSEEAKLTLVPLSLGVTGRLDLIDGQPIVPYGAVALDYWLWREREGSIDPTNPFDLDALGGGKPGYHYALGVNVLLDWLDPRGDVGELQRQDLPAPIRGQGQAHRRRHTDEPTRDHHRLAAPPVRPYADGDIQRGDQQPAQAQHQVPALQFVQLIGCVHGARL